MQKKTKLLTKLNTSQALKKKIIHELTRYYQNKSPQQHALSDDENSAETIHSDIKIDRMEPFQSMTVNLTLRAYMISY